MLGEVFSNLRLLWTSHVAHNKLKAAVYIIQYLPLASCSFVEIRLWPLSSAPLSSKAVVRGTDFEFEDHVRCDLARQLP